MTAASQMAYKSTLGELEDCEITWGRFDHFARHSHEGLMLSVIDAGQQMLEHNGKSYTASAGHVVAVAPDESHSSCKSREQGWIFRSLIVPNTLSQRLTGESKSHYYCDVSIDNPLLSKLLKSFFLAVPDKNVLALEVLLAETLDLFFEHHRKEKLTSTFVGKETKAVNIAYDYLAAHPHQNVSLVQLAEAANMDGFHLNRAFKKHYGLPPHTWHRQFRIKHAQQLLTAGVRPVEVACQCGFADQAHFTRTFKKVTGISPAKFAEHQRLSNRFESLSQPLF